MKNSPPYDNIIIGSGVAGSLIAKRLTANRKSVLLIEAGDEFDPEQSIVKSIFSNYWNGGILPMMGPFNVPFGQAKVLGGGSIINGALFWRLPEKIRLKWSSEFPDSVYASPDWVRVETSLLAEYGVSSQHESYNLGNEASKILSNAAFARDFSVLSAPRAVDSCKNMNRCGSGCPSNAKNDAVKVALRENDYLNISTGSTVRKLQNEKGCWSVSFKQRDQIRKAYAKRVILSAGATESANILRNSKLSTNAGDYFQFHLNFKLAAKFRNKIDPSYGTILSEQVQEFMDEGILMMSTNCRRSYLASSLSHLPPADISKYLSQYSNMGLFTVMVRPDVKAKVRSLFGQTVCFWSWTEESFERVKKAINLLADLLFDGGAEEVVLPVKNETSITSDKKHVLKVLQKIRPEELLGVSVHGMSACKMGSDEGASVVDLSGRVWGQENLYVMDSSILPGAIGESPQGAILTTVDMLVRGFESAHYQ